MEDLLKYTFSYSTFVHAVAGAAGGCIALTIFYPLDLARTRLQVDSKEIAHHAPKLLLRIATDEGIQAWYSGWLPVVMSQWCSHCVYFYLYNLIKQASLGEGGVSSAWRDLVYAFIAGGINVVVTSPLWVANSRIRLQGLRLKSRELVGEQQNYSGLIDAIVKIREKEGMWALWSGTLPSIVLASNPSIQFMVYEALKRYCQSLFSTETLPGLVYFLIGAASKTVATVVTYPLQLIQAQVRTAHEKGLRQRGLFDIVITKIRNEGIGSLFRGMEAKLIQTVLTAATMFLIYEKIVAFIFYVMGLTAPKKVM